jgi:XTP/dITP diphosphohydrolase
MVAATKNRCKIAEIQAIAGEFGIEVVSRDDAGVPDIEVYEDGATFEENSEKKAREIMALCGEVTIADDSGLMVDALGGAPGVFSARFSGGEGNDRQNNEKLLALLADVAEADRTAKFVSVITVLYPDGRKIVVRGECGGHIIYKPRGDGGFGYDPLFTPEGYDRTFGELSEAEKNRISHRSAALRQLKEQLSRETPHS